MFADDPTSRSVSPSFEPLEPRLLLDAGLLPGLENQPGPYLFEFSVDIGSDAELSDPNMNGNEAFDPGDVYLSQSGPVIPPGRDGFKDDAGIFDGRDPLPDPPDPSVPPATRVPVGQGGPENYGDFFDLDGHDQIDIYLPELVPPDQPLDSALPQGPSQCIFPAGYLMISMDDDMALGWPVADVPVTAFSPAGLTYGTTAGQDEIIGLVLAPGGIGNYTVVAQYPVADEAMLHPSLAPNPDKDEREDDDADSLDIVADQGVCPYWYFSVDHEANLGGDPGDIYLATPGGPVQVIDEAVHLGIPEEVDIDAFEFVWLQEEPQGKYYLALLFSVDEDDPLTQEDESGGGQPGMIYGSFLTGFSFPLLRERLWDDVDALTNWHESLGPELDWGDAPEPAVAVGYPTTAANSGANHVIGGPWLGDNTDNPDAELDGQPDPNALGDDNDGNDDEDGVQIPVLVQGQATSVPLEVNGAPAGGAYVDAWIDWNGDMTWDDASERVLLAGPVGDGLYSFGVMAPVGSVLGQTFARFRISTVGGLPPEGPAPDGEVEDYEVWIREADKDWGDAPDAAGALGYPTLSVNNGANHVIDVNLYLGASVDPEPDGQPDPNALGDDNDGNDDEDGVVFTTPLVQGSTAQVQVTASAPGLLSAWLDFNSDTDWADPGEQILTDVPLAAGPNLLTFPVYLSATPGQTFARFRFSSANGLPYDGPAPDGEVEDYEVWIDEAPDLIKWYQPPEYGQPDNVYYGWNEYSVYNGQQIVADDWVCTTDAAVTDIHWWGSFIGLRDPHEVPLPMGFHIGFWTDVPADPADPVPYSHPGQMIWEINCENFTYDFVGWDYDPIAENYEACFQFNQTLYPEEYFYQGEMPGTEPGQSNIYWISIAAVYPGGPGEVQYPWGWKTLPRRADSPAPDDAVRILDPTRPDLGSKYGSGMPIEELGISWDVAFELTTTQGVEKWRQEPNLDDTGMDVLAGPGTAWPYEKFLADDFECTQTGPITDMTIWGSYLDDIRMGEALLFNLVIYDDIPADQSPTGYSMPGQPLWSWYGSPVHEAQLPEPVLEFFFDPNQNVTMGLHQGLWQYDFQFNPGEEFVQQEGNIYWLGVHHSYDVNGDGIVDALDGQDIMNNNWSFGWKTTRDVWNDDAVWTDVKTPWGGSGQIAPPGGPWQELIHPDTGASLHMSFRLGEHGVTKWMQLPDTEAFSGLDVVAGPISDPMPVYEKFLADDFLCTESGLITQIKIWSSYLYDQEITPEWLPSFSLAIYSDVPIGPGGYSMPGELLWDAYLSPSIERVYARDVFEQFYDPNQQGIVGEDWTVWEYTFEIEPVKAFNQEEGNIYWLGVHHSFDLNNDEVVNLADVATLAALSPAGFGWKTSLDAFNDDAVWIDVDTFGFGEPHVTPVTEGWRELRYPEGHPFQGKSIDLAFAITTEPDKWLQRPDLDKTGLDVAAFDNGTMELVVLADDWRCTETGEIDQIIIWGSWYQDQLPETGFADLTFTLSIHDDRPADTVEPWSVPGETLWLREFLPGSYTVRKYAEDLDEGWWDPVTGMYDPAGDTVCWMYVFDLGPGEFIQEGKPGDPVIYWLDVQAHFDDTSAMFGWKTSLDHWNDDAVWYAGREPVPADMKGIWHELRYPAGHPMGGESIDLAFKIIGPGVKWSQPPEPYVPDDAFYGWDEYSVYGGQQIVADDWMCTDGQPVSDVHWWGSYIGWDGMDQLLLPDAFHFAIWTDVPVGVDEPFSHPGQVLWDHYCDNYTMTFAGWDFDPRDPMAPPEPTFYFEQDIPESQWFWQEQDDNIYWISISAIYDLAAPRYPFGWKTRPHDPAAPDDAVRIFDPTDPVADPPMVYTAGEPIWWPTPDESWDTAFVLTTADVTPPTVVDVQVKGTTWAVPDYSIPVGSAAQLHPLGWSTINQIEITFSEDVIVGIADMTLTGLNVPVYNFAGFSYDPFSYAATWTLTAAMDTDDVVIDVSAATVQDYAGNALDGEWTDTVSVYPSGDGVAGGNFRFNFQVLPGNANIDTTVDGLDYNCWSLNYLLPATTYKQGDFNADALTDGLDYNIWSLHYLQEISLPPEAAGSSSLALLPAASRSRGRAHAEFVEGMWRARRNAEERLNRRKGLDDSLDLLEVPDLLGLPAGIWNVI